MIEKTSGIGSNEDLADDTLFTLFTGGPFLSVNYLLL